MNSTEKEFQAAGSTARRPFYGWIIVAAGCITFGLANGIPYYNIGFFYDYFQRAFGWSRTQITFGFPLAALLTVWAGPLLVPKFSPRLLIILGTASTAAAFIGFGLMRGRREALPRPPASRNTVCFRQACMTEG